MASSGSKRWAKLIRCASETSRNSFPSPSKLHGRPVSADLQGGLAIPVKEHDAGLPGGVFVSELDCRRTVPLDVNYRDEAIRQDTSDGRSSFKILKSSHRESVSSPLVYKKTQSSS
jgi:hypothetical protein